MNSSSNQYPDLVCIITYLRKPFRNDFSKVEVKRVYAKALRFQLFRKQEIGHFENSGIKWYQNYKIF